MKKRGVESGKGGMSRRQFIVATGAATVGALVAGPKLVKPARAAVKDHIMVGYVNPATGPLATFGEPSPWVDERCLEAINKDGGIYIEEAGKNLPVRWKLVDSESNPTKAGELASRLVSGDAADILMPCHTPDTCIPVSAQAERYEVPCIVVDAPIEDWLTGGPYKWSFLHFWSSEIDIFNVFTGIWGQMETNRVVAALWPNDTDGTMWAEFFPRKGKDKGYTFIDPGRFPFMQADFSAQISMFKKANAEILTGVMITPDCITVLRQCAQMGFKPKVVTLAKGLMFPSAIDAIGSGMGPGLTSELWWSPYHPFKSSLTGESAKELCDAWEKAMNRAWTPPVGYKHSGWELVRDVMTRARTLDKEKIRQAIAATDMQTIVGPVKYGDKQYSRTPLVGMQWVKGDKWPWDVKVIYNQEYPNIAINGRQGPMQWPA